MLNGNSECVFKFEECSVWEVQFEGSGQVGLSPYIDWQTDLLQFSASNAFFCHLASLEFIRWFHFNAPKVKGSQTLSPKYPVCWSKAAFALAKYIPDQARHGDYRVDYLHDK